MANYMLNLVTFSKPSKEAIDLISNIDKWLPAPLFKKMTTAKLQNMLSSDSLLENYQNGLRKVDEFKQAKPNDERLNSLSNTQFQELVSTFLHNMENFGFPTAHEWRCEHWGGGGRAIEEPLIDDENTYIKYFSCWEHHHPVWREISKRLPNIVFEVKCATETFDDFEHYTIQNGVKTIIANPDILTDEEAQMNFIFQEDLFGEEAREDYEAMY